MLFLACKRAIHNCNSWMTSIELVKKLMNRYNKKMVYIESITSTKVSILYSIKVTKFEVAFKCEPSNQGVTTLMIEK